MGHLLLLLLLSRFIAGGNTAVDAPQADRFLWLCAFEETHLKAMMTDQNHVSFESGGPNFTPRLHFWQKCVPQLVLYILSWTNHQRQIWICAVVRGFKLCVRGFKILVKVHAVSLETTKWWCPLLYGTPWLCYLFWGCLPVCILVAFKYVSTLCTRQKVDRRKYHKQRQVCFVSVKLCQGKFTEGSRWLRTTCHHRQVALWYLTRTCHVGHVKSREFAPHSSSRVFKLFAVVQGISIKTWHHFATNCCSLEGPMWIIFTAHCYRCLKSWSIMAPLRRTCQIAEIRTLPLCLNAWALLSVRRVAFPGLIKGYLPRPNLTTIFTTCSPTRINNINIARNKCLLLMSSGSFTSFVRFVHYNFLRWHYWKILQMTSWEASVCACNGCVSGGNDENRWRQKVKWKAHISS